MDGASTAIILYTANMPASGDNACDYVGRNICDKIPIGGVWIAFGPGAGKVAATHLRRKYFGALEFPQESFAIMHSLE